MSEICCFMQKRCNTSWKQESMYENPSRRVVMLHDLPPIGHCFLGAAHSGADSPVEEQAVPSAYRHVLCGILHQFGCSDLHCTDGS